MKKIIIGLVVVFLLLSVNSVSGTPWDVTTASYLQNVSVTDKDDSPMSIFLKSDGSKMYFIGYGNDKVYEYDLSTPWNVSTATHSGNYSVTLHPLGLFFKSDGTKMYVTDTGSPERVLQYSLSTPWDVTTSSYLSTSYLAECEEPDGLFFKSDGTKMYVADDVFDNISEYTLSTPWDVTSKTHIQNFSVVNQDSYATDVFFNSSGTKMYISGSTNNAVFEYDLSTPWDVSTASYLRNISIASKIIQPQGVFFKPDGNKMYISSTYYSGTICEYDLSPYNVTSPYYGTIRLKMPTDTSFTVTLPTGYTKPVFQPPNSTATNYPPNGQTSSQEFYNISNSGNVNLDIRMRLNTTVSTITLKADDDNTPAGAQTIGTSLVTLHTGLAQGDTADIWLWSDFDHTPPQTANRTVYINVSES